MTRPLSPRKAAVKAGEKWYYGTKCLRGHKSRRNTRSMHCMECDRLNRLKIAAKKRKKKQRAQKLNPRMPRTRRDALRLGKPIYRGSICRAGHQTGRRANNRGCIECEAKRNAARYEPDGKMWINSSSVGKRMPDAEVARAYAGQRYQDIAPR